MGFLDNTTQTIDAILTKKGRELLARGNNEFKITKFALGDDEIDYGLYDVSHPDGTNSYGAAIENMPLLEAVPDENQIMRYKLVTLPKNTVKLPVIKLASSALTFTTANEQQIISPATTNGNDGKGGYTFILHNSDAADLFVSAGGGVEQRGGTVPVFLSDADRKRSTTVVGKVVNIVSKTTTSAITTQLTIFGNDSGASQTISVTVSANS